MSSKGQRDGLTDYGWGAEEGDTVKLDNVTLFKKEKITIIKGSYAMSSMNSKNIIYIFPLNKPLGHGMKNDEYEIFLIDDNVE